MALFCAFNWTFYATILEKKLFDFVEYKEMWDFGLNLVL